MGLKRKDTGLSLSKVTYLEFKYVNMDRVLTRLFERIQHNGYPGRLQRTFELTTEEFTKEFLEHPEWFNGFGEHPEVVARWIETHLMDVVNRGKPNQAIAAPRPLHGYTYRFRNPKHSRAFGADEHIYEMLYGAREGRGNHALQHLRSFFFPGIDPNTNMFDPATAVDVETQALLRLTDQVQSDLPDRTKRDPQPPLCVGLADVMADDVIRLLVYQDCIPRSVMVDYLKILLSFHLALYHLRLLKLLPSLVKRQCANPTCRADACPVCQRNANPPPGECPYQASLVVDIANCPDTHMAHLAEESLDTHLRRIPGFVKAHYAARKLAEFADHLKSIGKLMPPTGEITVADVLACLSEELGAERAAYFKMRLHSLLDDSKSEDGETDPQIREFVGMGLTDFETYVECLVAFRGSYHRRYITECLDSLMLKNQPGAMVAQPRTRGSRRRLTLDSRLLEVLLQLAVLRPGGERGFHTAELRIEELLAFLRERYGLYIDRLPSGNGFAGASVADQAALRLNSTAFRDRLREVGFYRDLSDAYVTQAVSPRYTIRAGEERGVGSSV